MARTKTEGTKRPRRPLAERLKEFTTDELSELRATTEATLELVAAEGQRRLEALQKVVNGDGAKRTKRAPVVDADDDSPTPA